MLCLLRLKTVKRLAILLVVRCPEVVSMVDRSSLILQVRSMVVGASVMYSQLSTENLC